MRAAFHGLGAAVGDAIHYSRPSAEFNRNLGRGFASPTATPAGKLSYNSANTILNFQNWFSHAAHRNRPSRFYRFMETFSAAELPVEDERFDVSTIRDQPIWGFAYTVDKGESDTIVFLGLHGLQDGDKVSVTSQVNPNIWDPIDCGRRIRQPFQTGSSFLPQAQALLILENHTSCYEMNSWRYRFPRLIRVAIHLD